jgi:hypothetical protein
VGANPRRAAGSPVGCDGLRRFRGMEGKNLLKTSKSRWQLLTSEVIATPGMSRAIYRVGSRPWLGNPAPVDRGKDQRCSRFLLLRLGLGCLRLHQYFS